MIILLTSLFTSENALTAIFHLKYTLNNPHAFRQPDDFKCKKGDVKIIDAMRGFYQGKAKNYT
jgi:hypothetical protein